jgi:hypothetical protein
VRQALPFEEITQEALPEVQAYIGTPQQDSGLSRALELRFVARVKETLRNLNETFSMCTRPLAKDEAVTMFEQLPEKRVDFEEAFPGIEIEDA